MHGATVQKQVLCMKTYVHLSSNFAEFAWQWEMLQTKAVDKIITQLHFQLLPSPQKNIVQFMKHWWKIYYTQTATHDSIIWHMCIACQKTNATDTRSEYVINIAFPQQQWHERASVLRYTYIACLLVPWHFMYLRTQR